MSALKVLFQALNNESDPYRVSIEPVDIQEAKVYQNTLELTKTKFTSRVYFKLENSSLSFENVKFEDSDETFTLYDKYEVPIINLNVGYYLAIFDGVKCVLVNDEGITKDELLRYDLLGEVLTEMLSGEDKEIDFSGLVKSINGQLPDLSGNVNIPQPIANSVKIDNSTIKSDADDTIYVDYSEIPFATYTNKGLVKIDSNTMNIANGTISVKNNGTVKSINNQSPDVNGNVNFSIPELVEVDNSTIKKNADNELYVDITNLDVATYDTKGLIKVDNDTLHVSEDGILSIPNGSVVKTINNHQPTEDGNVNLFIPEQIEIDNDTIKKNTNGKLYVDRTEVATATYDNKGLVKIDANTLSVSEDGTLSVNPTDVIKTINNQRPNNNGNINLVIPGAVTLDNDTIKTNEDGISYVDTSKLTTASVDTKGIVRVDGTSIVISEQGKISAVRQPRVTSGNIMSTVDAINGDIHLGGGDYKKIYQYNGFMKQWYEIADYSVNTDEFIAKTDIIDDLTSTSTTKTLSAKQGRELSGLITSHSGVRASKSSFGHVRIGDGLLVSNGTVSISEKEYLHCTVKTGNSDLTARSDIDLGDKWDGNINMSSNTSFYLSAGKKYLVTFDINIKFRDPEENNYCALSLLDRAANAERSISLIKVPVNRNTTESGNGILQTIVYPTTGGWYCIRCSGKTGSVYYEKYSGSLTIIEI